MTRSTPRRLLRWCLTCLAAVLGLGVLGFIALALFLPMPCALAKEDTVHMDLKSLRNALRVHSSKHQRFPSSEEGLQLLVDHQILEKMPRDPWGNPYRYELRDGQPVVSSLGADGLPGGEGADADIFRGVDAR